MFQQATRLAIGAALIAALSSVAPCLGKEKGPVIVDSIRPSRLEIAKVTVVEALGHGLPEVSAVEVTPPEGVTVTILPLSRLPKRQPGQIAWPRGAFEFSVAPEAVLGERQVVFVTPYGTRSATIVLFRPHAVEISGLAIVGVRKKPPLVVYTLDARDSSGDLGERPVIRTTIRCRGVDDFVAVDGVITATSGDSVALTGGGYLSARPLGGLCRLGVAVQDTQGNTSNWLSAEFDFKNAE